MLLAQKLISPAQLEEALETQVLHGGRLGTNLVELGFLKEPDLARTLGTQHNMPFASGEMVPDPTAMSLAPKQFFDDEDVLPMRIEPTRVSVVVLGPNQVKATDALGFKAGKRVVSVVIPEFRMHQLLRAHCKAFRPLRPIDMQTLRPSKKEQKGPNPGDASDLINEDDFAKLYADAVQESAPEEEVIEGAVLEEAPVLAPIPSAPVPTGVTKAPPPKLVEQQLPPLDFAQAQKQLQSSTNREDIARTVLQFARSKFRRALILNVRGDLVTGWHGLGIRVTERAVRRIGVSLREQNSFRLVRDLKSHFMGPMKRTPGMEVFYSLLGGAFPQTAVILPLLVRGKPVHMLYLDHGPKQVTPPDVGELLILSQGVARSYESLITAARR
jgi:hypothetical protein